MRNIYIQHTIDSTHIQHTVCRYITLYNIILVHHTTYTVVYNILLSTNLSWVYWAEIMYKTRVGYVSHTSIYDSMLI